MVFVTCALHSQDKRWKQDKILRVVYLTNVSKQQHETLTALRLKETAEKTKAGWHFVQYPPTK